MPEAIFAFLFCDQFESHWCASCGNTGAAYVIPPEELVVACTRCLLERIALLRSQEPELPEWVMVLEGEAKRQIAYEARKAANELTLDFDSFYKCCRCGKLIHQKDARYPLGAADEFN